MQIIKIYTDGACSGNPGPGSWAVVIRENKFIEAMSISGLNKSTTNNRMELEAVVQALNFVKTSLSNINNKKRIRIDIYSDSAYVVNAVEKGWLRKWSFNGWKTRSGDNVKNQDLWIDLLKRLKDQRFKISLIKVKGHSGNKYNEIADDFAQKELNKYKEELHNAN